MTETAPDLQSHGSQVTWEAHTFTYRWRYLFMGFSAFVTAAFVGLWTLPNHYEGSFQSRVLLSIPAIMVVLVSFITIVTQSDIVIDHTNISRMLLGRIWKTINWQDVKRIRIYLIPRIGLGITTYVSCYCIDAGGRRGNAISFCVDNFPGLVDLLDRYIAHYHIEILDHRKQA